MTLGIPEENERLDQFFVRCLQDTDNFTQVVADLKMKSGDPNWYMQFWSQDPLSSLSVSGEQKAEMVGNCLDYFIESHLLDALSRSNVENYVNHNASLYTYVGFDWECEADKPLILETCHHRHMAFILYALSARLKPFGILLRLNDKVDGRVIATSLLAEERYGVQTMSIQIKKGWLHELADCAGPDTVIIYMSDFARKQFPQRLSKKSGRGSLDITHEDGTLIKKLETVNFAPSLAQSLGAQHAVMSFSGREVCLSPKEDSVALTVPLVDWALWPGMSLYDAE